ncbi:MULTISPECIES: hypothetical protein [unclassified Ensifer]|uniref:hypothetical protein n=1 Tax=unclassified Ensifer TaxID=2633371 RepID=UPI00115FA6B3|nr:MULTISPECIES: hypothetical protein [unclassified Ensifer]MBD9596844.1 hypothetical protein [Ensifer sp. ENS05]
MIEETQDVRASRKFSTGLPIGVMLLAMVVIGGYLFVGTALSNTPRQQVATVLPTPVARSN